MYVLKNHEYDSDGRSLGDPTLRERLSEELFTVGFDPHDGVIQCPICGKALDPTYDGIYIGQDKEPVGCELCIQKDFVNDEDGIDLVYCPVCGEASEIFYRDQDREIIGCDRCITETFADD